MEWEEFAKKLTDPEEARFKDEALKDVTVLDISYAQPAAHVTSSILAEFGARVIKIEPPEGDALREISPFGEFYFNNTGLNFLVEGRNKEFITLNIEKEEGRELFKKLVSKADVVIESYPPGYMDKLGIGYRQLKEINPGLIYLAFSAHGHFGKKAKEFAKIPDSNLLGIANSGYMYACKELDEAGEPYNLPTSPGFWMGSYFTAIYAVSGVLLALLYRNRTGEGQMIDVTSTEVMMKITMELQWVHVFKEPVDVGVLPLDAGVFSYAYYKIKDGYVFAAGYTDDNFRALVTQIEAPEIFEKYPTVFDRTPLEKQKEAYKDIQKAIEKFTFEELARKMVEWKKRGEKGTAIYAKVMTPKEVLEDKYWWEKAVFRKYKDRRYPELVVVNSPWRFSETPPKLKWICKNVGEDNEFVYRTLLGLSKEDLENLRKNNVI
ncbi:CoA transferase [Ferroglobus sp.]|uniref:CaiB/BaiF CoA transferase family protein n=1 Tax=Ferroglobus sp. TaxID=2614230 RepID=UPI0025BAD7F4|nr:CoA transferase [Ferroglobus sp.]